MSASPAVAEVLLTFGIEQRLETGWNIDLLVPEDGRTTASITRLSFGAVTRTPLDALEFNAAAALVVENADDTGGTEVELGRPSLELRYTREVPNAIFMIGAQYRQDDVDAFDEDLAEADRVGTRTDSSIEMRLETGRTAPLGFAFISSFSRTEYEDTTDPTLTDTDTLRVGVETRLRFSEVLEGRIGLGYAREDEADALGTVVETETATLGLTYAMANGTATAELSFSSDDEEGDRTTLMFGRTLALPAGSLSARLGVSDGDIGGTDLVGGLSWSQELPRGGLDVVLERRIGFDEDTVEAVTNTLVSVSLAREINETSSLSLLLSHEISDAPSERIDLSQFSATYRYDLTEYWGLDAGARYRVRHDASGRSESPDVFIALSRSFEFRP